MLNSIRSVVYFSDNLQEAGQWYEHILGIAPYRSDDNFVGFHLGDCDLCLHPKDQRSTQSSQVLYWTVDDLDTTIAALQAEGSTLNREPISVPEGGRVAQLEDPFGNILGLTELD
jgi:predicted enzyme related to lactoylglutathione lyase